MNANEILKKHEDANEMHFHEVDRKWIIEAMEEYAALRQPPVSGSASDFERELYKLINEYVSAGLKKPDLVHKMEYVTQSCLVS